MPKVSILPRGFKSKAEKLSAHYRDELSLHICAPLSAFQLAEHLKIPIHVPADYLKDQSEASKLMGTDSEDSGWSALTMQTKLKKTIIIHNPRHSATRQQSNIMHELAHIICEHKFKMKYDGINIPFGMRHFDEQQEEEAKCLGACLQITRPGLLWGFKRNMSVEDIASHFSASFDMVKYRINSTGVKAQLQYMGRSMNFKN